nr:ribonucleoside-diphosphate reductase large subunit [Cydia pomonella granulovirus]WOZ30475.1 ribonucleoside-diphosphate reductase large subunit [Cydia pomonella granulovirus]WOZ30607.1 ribonucleoside-diphosphate reductase large subunit [Cydia pomonella granulovirus]WOZ45376.1 ribonucleoside-diphosphate reductase large subunit [Cydia pomonella granulovirus]WOZ45567.1 ribonucleoside-diphosphate reductase large subunit [Cydia pomonella granulovirus]
MTTSTRINNLQAGGNAKMSDRMFLAGESPDQFVHRMSRLLTNNHPTKSDAVAHLLSSVSLIPSSSLCHHFNTGDGIPSACCLFVFSKDHNVDAKFEELTRIARVAIKGTGVGIGADSLKNKSITRAPGELRNTYVDFCKSLNHLINLSVTVRQSRVAVYVSLHNTTAYESLFLRQTGNIQTENIFYGIMVPDLFVRKQKEGGVWHFFDNDAQVDGKSLNDCYGEEYERLYEEMVRRGIQIKSVNVWELWGEIVNCLATNGYPYIVWRDTVNKYNNQQALGVVKTLNLCAEVCQHATDSTVDTNTSLCTLMTLNVAAFCEDYTQHWHLIYDDLRQCQIPEQCIPPLGENKILDHCFYGGYMSTFVLNCVLGESKRREIGVSPTGLFDALHIMYGAAATYEYAMDDYSARVAEYIYLGCVVGSVVYNRLYGVECVNFRASRFSEGVFQFDLRGVTPSLTLQWACIRPHAMRGMANSMLTTQAPTATTSQITNVTESVQYPLPGRITTKNSETGRFADLPFYAHFTNQPPFRHPHVSPIRQIKVFANTAPYVDQSQSTIIYCEPKNDEISKVLVYTHKAQLKTGVYYLTYISPTRYIQLGNGDEEQEYYEQVKRARSKFGGCDGCTL